MTGKRRDLTPDDIEEGYANEGWLGYGYLGIKEKAHGKVHGVGAATLKAQADRVLLEQANAEGWTPEQLFDWLNSKLGRWYGEVMLLGSMGELTPGEIARAVKETITGAQATLAKEQGR